MSDKVDDCRDVDVDLAGLLYAAYSEEVGGVNFRGDALPTWEEFSMDSTKTKQTEGWIAVALKAYDILVTDKLPTWR